jgi:hypothetical protein
VPELIVLAKGLAVVGGEDDHRARTGGDPSHRPDQIGDGLVLSVDCVLVLVEEGGVFMGRLARRGGLKWSIRFVDAIREMGVCILHDGEPRLGKLGDIARRPLGDELVAGAVVDIRLRIEVGSESTA